MTATDKLFARSIPEIYDRLLVPLIFEPYAQDLAGRITLTRPSALNYFLRNDLRDWIEAIGETQLAKNILVSSCHAVDGSVIERGLAF